MNWSLKVKKEFFGDEVKLTFELKKDEQVMKRWGRVVRREQLKVAIESAEREAKEFASNYGKVEEEEIPLFGKKKKRGE